MLQNGIILKSVEVSCSEYNVVKPKIMNVFKYRFVFFTILLLSATLSCEKEKTSSEPEIITVEVTEVTATTAVGRGRLVEDGGSKVTSIGVCWGTGQYPTINDYFASNETPDDTFKVTITGLADNSTYYLRAYATNIKGTGYGEQVQFTTFAHSDLPIVKTSDVDNITSSSALVGGVVISHGGTLVKEQGVYWSARPDPVANGIRKVIDNGWSNFQTVIEGLDIKTQYYIKAYAKNNSGTSYGELVTFETTDTAGACEGVAPPSGYKLVAYNGRCWLDRNLGASQTATAIDDINSFGNLFQWGRKDDSHQLPNSLTTRTLAPPGEQANHSDFIVKDRHPFDWNADNNWKYRWVTPTGNTSNADPCPVGWRVPTQNEWQAAMDYGNWSNKYDAFDSPLKLPSAGKRDDKGVVYYRGTRGYYWSSSYNNIFGQALLYYDTGAFISNYYKVGGMSVRCIKDN